MSDFVDNHPLSGDLPDLKASIHVLKSESARFAREMHNYESIDKEIVRIEQGIEYRSDDELDALKMKRVHLKDSLYQQAKAHADRVSKHPESNL